MQTVRLGSFPKQVLLSWFLFSWDDKKVNTCVKLTFDLEILKVRKEGTGNQEDPCARPEYNSGRFSAYCSCFTCFT